MSHFKEIQDIFPLEVLLRIFSFLDLTEIVELSKINPYFMQLAKIAYTEKVVNSKIIMEINLGTEQPINIRYECSRFNRKTQQTVWKPTAIIGAQNRRSVNTKEKVILRRIFFENEPHMSGEYYNLVHEVSGAMDIKDSGIECIKGEENLVQLKNLNKKLVKNAKNKKHSFNGKFSSKSKKQSQKPVKNENVNNTLTNNSEGQKDEMINTELIANRSITSRSSIYSTNSLSTTSLPDNYDEGLMINENTLFFSNENTLVKDTIKWSFEYKVDSILKPNGESWQKLQPSKLRLPIELFYQNKPEDINKVKKRNYGKYKSIVKKSLINILERFSNSFVGVV